MGNNTESTSKVLKGGIIGLGKMGILHSAIVNSSEHSQLSAISEKKDLTGKVFSSFNPNISLYNDYEKMISNEDLDFIFITTPPDSHISIATSCALRGIPFCVEKPLCTKTSDSEDLIRVLEDYPVINMVGFMKRYLNSYLKAKEILSNNILGKIFTCHSTAYVSQLFGKGRGWRYKKDQSGGGVFISIAIHALDLIQWFFGLPHKVSATMISEFSMEVEDFGHATMTYKHGVICTLDTSWSVHNHRLLETTFVINGTNGRLFVNEDSIKLFLIEKKGDYNAGWTTLYNPDLYEGGQIDVGGYHFTKQDEAFIKAVKSGVNPGSDVNNAVKVHQLLDAIYKSAKYEGDSVYLQE